MKTTKLALLLSISLLTHASLHAQPIGRTAVVAVTGDTAPDGIGEIASVSLPTLNDKGQIAFQSSLVGTGLAEDHAIFVADGVKLTQIARTGDAIPNSSAAVDRLGSPVLNDAGEVAFVATGFGVLRGDKDKLTPIALSGQTTPDGNGLFAQIETPTINDAGQVAFRSLFSGTRGGLSDNLGIVRGDGIITTMIARTGDPAPDGNGKIVGFFEPRINDAGEAAFVAHSDSFRENRGVLRGDGMTLTQIAKVGEPAPDSNGIFDEFVLEPVPINNAGQVAFRAFFDGTSAGFDDRRGIVRGDGVSLTQLARFGQPSPDGNVVLASFRRPSLNERGQIAFSGRYTGSSGDGLDRAILMSDGGDLTQIARTGDATASGDGTLFIFEDPVINDLGHVVFAGFVQGVEGEFDLSRELFFYDQRRGLTEVIGVGDQLLGSTVTEFETRATFEVITKDRSSLNNRGQVAYYFELADGRSGIAIWTIPEPTSLMLLSVVGLGVFVFKRCRG